MHWPCEPLCVSLSEWCDHLLEALPMAAASNDGANSCCFNGQTSLFMDAAAAVQQAGSKQPTMTAGCQKRSAGIADSCRGRTEAAGPTADELISDKIRYPSGARTRHSAVQPLASKDWNTPFVPCLQSHDIGRACNIWKLQHQSNDSIRVLTCPL